MFPGFYDEIHEEFRSGVREFVERNVAPHYQQWSQQHQMPRSLWEAAAADGLLGLAISEEHGGLDLGDYRFRMILDEELVRCGALAVALAFHLHDDWVLPALLHYGTDEQKAHWLPRFADASFISAAAFTEPGAGSDLRAIRSTVTQQNDGDFHLNGQKTFIGNGITSDGALVLARDGEAHSLFLVEKEGNPGFKPGRQLHKIGLEASDTAELFFDDVHIPAQNLIGERGQGLAQVKTILAQGRLGLAVGALTVVNQVLADTLRYTTEREAFGSAVAQFQNTRFRLAEISTDLAASQRLLAAAIGSHQRAELTLVEASQVKLHASELAQGAVDSCLQLHGGYGYITEYPVSQAFLAVRLMRIFGGTSEILKETIAQELFSGTQNQPLT